MMRRNSNDLLNKAVNTKCMNSSNNYHIPRLYLFPSYWLIVKKLPNNNCKGERHDDSSHNTEEI